MWIVQSPSKPKVKPKPFFLYYGILSLLNGLNSTEIVSYLQQYSVIVLRNPQGSSQAADVAIINQLVESGKSVFLYTYLGDNGSSYPVLTDAQLSANIDYFDSLGCNTFLDQGGYDFHTYRTQQKFAVDYVHSKGKKVMINPWNPSDIFGLYPDRTVDFQYNSTGLTPANLGVGDFVLVESFGVSYNGYRNSGGSSTTSDRNGYFGEVNRIARISTWADKYGFNIASLSYARTTNNTNGGTVIDSQSDVDFSYRLASLCNFPYYCVATLASLGSSTNAFGLFTPSESAKDMDSAKFVSPIVVQRSDRAVMNRSIGGVDYQYSTGSIITLPY